MRKGFGINIRKNDLVSVNKEPMTFTIEGLTCTGQYRDITFTVGDNEFTEVNDKITVCFQKFKGVGARGRIVFYCDNGVQVYRQNHPAFSLR